MWTKEHPRSKRNIHLSGFWNTRVRIEHDKARAFGEHQRIARPGTVAIAPRTASIRDRTAQAAHSIVSIDARSDLISYVRRVSEKLSLPIPAWLGRRVGWKRHGRAANDRARSAIDTESAVVRIERRL